ncbi:Maf family protein [Basilea psittacipulmonis]|uniref:7-methyl-GTP pyrophosphatase n=1 Tax=Basilea psittacipulmonis DSM 24701 TaxID=1072685 RepID=A0A077DEJ8_9BURK|nr:Maf family nucleotide pyrophosphatase [Basilea psittacipulmonis]AIL33255.1 septum formation inhibitor Maf [Basilea psittacipulmonis DSM 24701]
MKHFHLILASSSKYRQEMLKRLGLPFTAISPDIDETRHQQESPQDLALRLSYEKACAIAQTHPDAIVIGSDQVACLGDEVLGKPGNFETAFQQLKAQSNQTLYFHTALTVIHGWHVAEHQPRIVYRENVPTICAYRELSDDEITHYLHTEKPFDTAGSAKAESLGISLMQYMRSDDPTAIIGLPLIALSRMLRDCGLNPTLLASK